MKSRYLFTIALAMVAVTVSAPAFATKYYIAANGADTNPGTSKTAPWAHAPGMTNCSGACAAKVPAAGDQFIFRGGDTWHTSAGAPIGLPWKWTWSGVNGSPIYLGVDKTWYAGTSWHRPVLTMDNPLTTSHPASCKYDDSNISALNLKSVNYVTVDNFEFTGKCWSGAVSQNSVAYLYRTGTYITVQNSYFHGWTLAGNAWDGHAAISGYGAAAYTDNLISGVVIDGSDSTHDTTAAGCANAVNGAPCNTGWGIQGDCFHVRNSVIRYTSNAIVCANPVIIHDNLIEFTYATMDGLANGTQGPHPNVVEALGGYKGLTFYLYNNIIRHNAVNVTLWPQFATGYEFNNVLFDNSKIQAGNCMMQSPTGFAKGVGSSQLYVYNNTIEAQCTFNFYPGNNFTPTWSGPSHWSNNHLVGSSKTSVQAISSCPSPSSCTFDDRGNELFQTESVANGQGYTATNGYAPTKSTNSTVGQGANATSFCSALPFIPARSACQSGFAGISYDSVNHAVIVNKGVSRPTTGPWDIGAYQFSTTAPLSAPSSIEVSVH